MSSSEEEETEVMCTPPEIVEAADNVRVDLLPQKSRDIYWSTYNAFIAWKNEKKVDKISENVLLAYFGELVKKYKPSTLWTKYSMLRSTIQIKHNIKLKDCAQLLAFLKQKSSGYEAKKSKVITPDEAKKFLRDAPDEKYLLHKVALIFGLFGACRHAELCSLPVVDVSDLGNIIKVVLRHTKNKTTRTFVVEGEFVDIVKAYQLLRPTKATEDRFFLTYRNGRCINQPIGKNKFGSMPKEIAQYLQLADPQLYTGHAFRRSSATLCADQGFTMTDLKRLGGWKSTTVTEGYIEDSMNHKRKASNQINSVIAGTSHEAEMSEVDPKRTNLGEAQSVAIPQNLSDLVSKRGDHVSLNIAHSSNINIHFHNK